MARELTRTHFTFHRELGSQHEDAMEEVSSIVGDDPALAKSFESGVKGALNLSHGCWAGLAKN